MQLKFLTLGIVVSLLALSSCKKDKDPDPDTETKETTVAEDKANINKGLDDIVNCAEEVKSGQLVSLVQNMFEIRHGEGNEQLWLESMVDSLPLVFDFDQVEDANEFRLNDFDAKYTYNSSTKLWSKTDENNGKIIVEFPSTNGGPNDLRLVIDNYTDRQYLIDGENIPLPTKALVTFSQNGTTLVEINLKRVQYEQLETITIPTYIEATMVLAPLDIEFIARRVNPTLFDAKLTITNGGSCNTEVFAELKLKNSDLENLLDEDFDYLKGHLSNNDLKITTDMDLGTLLAIDDPSDNQINSLTNFDVLYEGKKVGDLDIDSETEKVFITYKDGSKDDVEDVYLVPFAEKLELALFDLVGNWD